MENKTVFVTGATRGIGRAIAFAFAEKRYDVIANYRNEEAAKSLNEAITAKGVRCLTLKGDVSSPADCDYMFEQIEKEFGHLDVLVNNAGITRDSLTLRMSEEDFKAVTDVNLFGVFNCMKRAFKMMMKKKAGRIISISSISGITGNPGQINYSAAKAGVIGMTKTLAKEAASRGITVNAIAPGFIETDMTAELPEKIAEHMLECIPLNRFGKTDDIANAALFLASEGAGYITGQIVVVDGGLSI